jgi:nicotinamidase-related amidase
MRHSGDYKRALVVVDMSVEQVASIPSRWRESIVRSIQTLASMTPGGLASSSSLFDLHIDSRLWLHSPTESTLSWAYPEWGSTMGIPGSTGAARIPELDGIRRFQFVEKKHFSSFVDSNLFELLRDAQISEVVLAGINTDYCIFNTAMDSFARGRFRTVVIEDAVASLSGVNGHLQGLQWIRAHLGPQAVQSLDEYVHRG